MYPFKSLKYVYYPQLLGTTIYNPYKRNLSANIMKRETDVLLMAPVYTHTHIYICVYIYFNPAIKAQLQVFLHMQPCK